MAVLMKSGSPGADHKWEFKARFRSRAFGWRGSDAAIGRLKEAVSEIRKVAKTDLVVAADGAVALMQRFWPAFQDIDTSSGRLGNAINNAVEALIPVLTTAPAVPKVRGKWLERLFQAVQDDGVQYLWLVEQRWGEIAVYPEFLNDYADQLSPLLRLAWSDGRPGGYVAGTDICLSSLLEVGRYQDLFELLALQTPKIWGYQHFGAEALARQGHIDAAFSFAEACRTRHDAVHEDSRINAFCERILIEAGRSDEAYQRYGVQTPIRSTYVATYRALVAKYPDRDRREILQDLIGAHGLRGKWFAAAKDAGFLDIASDCARAHDAEPATVARAARDFVAADPKFALELGLIAINGMLLGQGYDPTADDLAMAFDHLMVAASALDCDEWATEQIAKMVDRPAMIGREFLLAELRRRMLGIGKK